MYNICVCIEEVYTELRKERLRSMDIKIKAAAALLSLALVLCGCASASEPSSATETSAAEDTSSSQTADESADESGDTSGSELPEQQTEPTGPLLTKACEVFRSGTYSFECDMTDSEGNVTHIIRHVAPNNFYQLQSNALGSSGSVCQNGVAYDFDNVCRLCASSNNTTLDNTILEVADMQLPHTTNHISKVDLQEYDIEEYTYTGETYITAFDFYFSKDSGELVKYVTTYSVEGSDDIVETREFTSISSQVDDTLFNIGIVSNLTKFDDLTQDDCKELFSQICDNAGVTDSDLAAYGTDREKLGRLDYSDIVKIVYTYGYKDTYERSGAEASEADGGAR